MASLRASRIAGFALSFALGLLAVSAVALRALDAADIRYVNVRMR